MDSGELGQPGPHHVAACGLERFRDDPEHISGVVRFDRQGDWFSRPRRWVDAAKLAASAGVNVDFVESVLYASCSPTRTSRPKASVL